MKKKTSILLVFCLLLTLITGCSSKDDSFGEKYVQSLLDANYKGFFTDYMQLTDSSEDEAYELYQANLIKEANYFEAYIAEAALSDDDYLALIEFYRDLYMSSSYIVRASGQDKDDYLVEVKIKPIANIYNTYEKIIAFDDEFFTKYEQGEFDELEDLEVENLYANGIFTIVQDSLGEIEYDQEISRTIRVTKDSDGYYFVSDKDWEEIDYDIIKY